MYVIFLNSRYCEAGDSTLLSHLFQTCNTSDKNDKQALFLGEGDLDGGGGGDLEALEGVPGSSRLHLCLELHKCNVVSSRNQSDLLESRELVEKHAEHHLIGLLRQVGEEEDLVRRRIVEATATSMTSTSLVKATTCSPM